MAKEIILEYWPLILFAAYTFLIITVTSFSKRINAVLNILGMNVPLIGAAACFIYGRGNQVFIITGAALLFIYAAAAMWMVFRRAMCGATEKTGDGAATAYPEEMAKDTKKDIVASCATVSANEELSKTEGQTESTAEKLKCDAAVGSAGEDELIKKNGAEDTHKESTEPLNVPDAETLVDAMNAPNENKTGPEKIILHKRGHSRGKRPPHERRTFG